LKLGDESKGNICFGRFDIPLTAEPANQDWFNK
jgi:hypothetical protein